MKILARDIQIDERFRTVDGSEVYVATDYPIDNGLYVTVPTVYKRPNIGDWFACELSFDKEIGVVITLD